MSDVLTEKDAEISPELKMLIKAKELSDKRQYIRKNALLRELLHKSPNDFVISDATNHGIVGLTHIPTNFKIHTLERNLPGVLKVAFDLKLMRKEAGKEQLAKIITNLGKDEASIAREAKAVSHPNVSGYASASKLRDVKPRSPETPRDVPVDTRNMRPDFSNPTGPASFVPRTHTPTGFVARPAAPPPSVPFTPATQTAARPAGPQAKPTFAMPTRATPAQPKPVVEAPRPVAEATKPVAEAPRPAEPVKPQEVNDPLGIEEFKRENLDVPSNVFTPADRANPVVQAVAGPARVAWNVAKRPFDSFVENLPVVNKYIRDPINRVSRKYLLDPIYNSVIEPFNKMYKSVGNKAIDKIFPVNPNTPEVFKKPQQLFEMPQQTPPLLSSEGMATRAKGVANEAANYGQYAKDLAVRPFESAARAGTYGLAEDAFSLANRGAKGLLNASTAVPYHIANAIRPTGISSAVTRGLAGLTAYQHLPKIYKNLSEKYNEIMDLQKPEGEKSYQNRVRGAVEKGTAAGAKDLMGEGAKRVVNAATSGLVEPINALNLFPPMKGNVFQTNQDPATNAFFKTVGESVKPYTKQVLSEQTHINPTENPAHAFRATSPYGSLLYGLGKTYGESDPEILREGESNKRFQTNLANELDKLPMSTWLQNPIVRNVSGRVGNLDLKDMVTGQKAINTVKALPFGGQYAGALMSGFGADKAIDKNIRMPLNQQVNLGQSRLRNFSETGKVLPPELAEKIKKERGEEAYLEAERTAESALRHAVSSVLKDKNLNLATRTGQLAAAQAIAGVMRDAEKRYVDQEGNVIPREVSERVEHVAPGFQQKEQKAEDVIQSDLARKKLAPLLGIPTQNKQQAASQVPAGR